MRVLQKIVYLSVTVGIYCIYCLKSCLNAMIGGILSLLLVVSSPINNSLGKAYIPLTLLIIFCLAADHIFRSNSKTFDLIFTIFSPVNVGIGMEKIIVYKWYTHVLQLAFFCFLELLKIIPAIYCIIFLSLVVETHDYLHYWILSILLVESLLGFLSYFFILASVLIITDFYVKWLNVLTKWYLKNCVEGVVYLDGPRVILEYNKILPV